MNSMSPYAATKIVNEWIKNEGIEKTLPPQMIYTYTKKGYIPSVTDESGKRTVTVDALKTWFDEKYGPKNLGLKKVETEEVVDEDQLNLFEDAS